jgi:crotonobetaine/carnitine-CoA ligase
VPQPSASGGTQKPPPVHLSLEMLAKRWSARYTRAMSRLDTRYERITDPLRAFADLDGDAVFCYADDQEFTYAALWQEVQQRAGGLAAIGVKPGTHVALMLDNHADFLIAWFAVTLAGGVEVPVNTAFQGDSMRYILGQSESTILIIEEQYLDRLEAVRAHLPALRAVVVRGPNASGGDLAWSSLRGDPIVVEGRTIDPAAVMYTSGTTGRSKGVVLPHRYFLMMAAGFIRNMSLSRDDVYYTCLPLFHGMAQLSGTMAPLCAGAKMALVPRFSLSRFWDDCRRFDVTAFGAIAAMTSLLQREPPSPVDRLHRVRFGFAVAVPEAIEQPFEQRFGIRLINGFGMTEAGQMTYMPYDEHRPGSCGRPVDLYDLEIHDDADRPMPTGEVGEIVVRPRSNSVTMLGYHKMPEETVTATRNLWLHTGDLGRLDDDQFLYFVDRSKDAIRRRGENISSVEVEAALLKNPNVAEVAAYPVPSTLGEDEVMVAVVLTGSPVSTAAELVEHCIKELPGFAVPTFVRIVDELPKTPTHKVEKYRLRAEGVTADTFQASRSQVATAPPAGR